MTQKLGILLIIASVVLTYLRIAHLAWTNGVKNIATNKPEKYVANPPTYTAFDTTEGNYKHDVEYLNREFCQEESRRYTLNKLPEYLSALDKTPSTLMIKGHEDGVETEYSPGVFRSSGIKWLLRNVMPTAYKVWYWLVSPFLIGLHAKRYKAKYQEGGYDGRIMVTHEGNPSTKFIGKSIIWGVLAIPSAIAVILLFPVWVKLKIAYVTDQEQENISATQGVDTPTQQEPAYYQPSTAPQQTVNEPPVTPTAINIIPQTGQSSISKNDVNNDALPNNLFEGEAPTELMPTLPNDDGELTVHLNDTNLGKGVNITQEAYSNNVDNSSFTYTQDS